MNEKTCRKCGDIKPLDQFPKMQGGYRPRCKPCHVEDSRKWAIKNHDRYINRLREWYDKNKRSSRKIATREEKLLKKREYNKIWTAKNKDRFDEMRRVWASKNKHVQSEVVRRRQVSKRKATPDWANRFFMQEAYHLAMLRTKATGKKWSVDHIVPIISPLVCGLHVESNLQVIPHLENMKKSNRHWPDMPETGFSFAGS